MVLMTVLFMYISLSIVIVTTHINKRWSFQSAIIVNTSQLVLLFANKSNTTLEAAWRKDERVDTSLTVSVNWYCNKET